MNPKVVRFPLLGFFEALRANELFLKLGLYDYDLLRQAMVSGFKVHTSQDLLRLCKLIWLKSSQVEESFEKLFYKHLKEEEQEFEKLIPSVKKEKTDTENDTVNQKEQEKNKNIKSPETSPKNDNKQDIETSPSPETDNNADSKTTGNDEPSGTIPDSTNVYLNIDVNSEEQQEVATGDASKVMAKNYYFRFNESNKSPLLERLVSLEVRKIKESIASTPSDVIDIDLCVVQIAKTGRLTRLYHQSSSKVITKIIVFIDTEGSMTPFEYLSEHFLAILKAQGIHTEAYYYYNVPFQNIYSKINGNETKEYKLEEVVLQINRQKLPVVVISDAGTAKGQNNPRRLKLTNTFLEGFQSSSIAWLNPMPKSRWHKSSITELVKESRATVMFEMNTLGIRQAMKHLKKRNQYV